MNKKAQIVATVGPSSKSVEVLRAMIAGGMNVVRLNFSWGSYEEHTQYIHDVRMLAQEAGIHIPIIQDLSGPRIQETHGHEFDVHAVTDITEKDMKDLSFGLSQNVDYVALSFVGNAGDIVQLKKLIQDAGKSTPVIAKIERAIALQNIDEIIAATDAIMIARGDLGNEIPLEKIPFIEKTLIAKCKSAGKPVITATQMMLSMTKSPTPTRAEVTDVAYAILNGSDAVMLSEESANGEHPVEAVSMMNRIIAEAETHIAPDTVFHPLV